MRFVIGIICFWLTIFGIKKFLENTFKVSNKFSFVLVFTWIGIIMFVAGILNVMKITAILLVISSIIYLTYLVIHKEIKFKDIKQIIKKPNIIVIILIFLYITFVGIGMHITHYDNFSHWGLIIKNMFMTDSLPNFESPILFKGYQPGSACFIYFFGLLCGKTEASMIIGQNYLIFAFLTCLFTLIKKGVLKRILLIAFYIFIMTISIAFNNLLVDSLIAVMAISVLAMLDYNKTNPRKGLILTAPILIFLLLVKNTGVVLIGICYIYILFLYYKNKQLKRGIKDTVIFGIILLIFLLIWQNHVTMVYGTDALNSKHSLSLSNVFHSLQEKGIGNIISFIKNYFFHFFSFKDNVSNIYMLVIISFTLLYLAILHNKKSVIKLLITSVVVYIGYYIILGVMYLLSMPWEEAIIYAGYERYMTTILIIIVGIIIIHLLNNKELEKYKLKVLIIIGVMTLLIPICYNQENFKALIGKTNYEGSIVEKYDYILPKIPIDKTKTYYIYAPVSSKNDAGLLYHLSIYKLNLHSIVIIDNIDQVYEEQYGIYVVFDDVDEINKKLENYDWKKETKEVYIRGDIEL